MNLTPKPILGFLPANRPVFSQELARKMRDQTLAAMTAAGIEVIAPDPADTKIGCVQSIAEAEHCADLFRRHHVQGIVIGAVNFGDEQAAAWTVRQARLDVPILLFGAQEEHTLTVNSPRRDSFCGLLSIGEALRQLGVPYSVAPTPVGFPSDKAFADALDWFVRVCRVVNGVRHARYGQVGARPEAFWTCRFDEKQLQRLGPTTVVIDLSEVFAGANAIRDNDPELIEVLDSIHDYADTSQLTKDAVKRSGKLELFLRRWSDEHALNGLAIQCWTSIQQHYGICSCTTMSRFTDAGVPAACEADILGTLSMHACQLASGTPAALADWNNLHNEDEDLVNIWHCGVFPKALAKERPRLNVHNIIVSAGVAPFEQAQGIVELVVEPSPVTLSRITQDPDGPWKALIVEGDVEDNPAATIGSYGWCRVPRLQHLYRNVLLKHFPHHVAMTRGRHGNALWEAFGNYLGFQVHHGDQVTPGLYTPAWPFMAQ